MFESEKPGLGSPSMPVHQCIGLLRRWLERRLSPEQRSWLDAEIRGVEQASGSSVLAAAIAIAPRRLGKARLALDASEQRAAMEMRAGVALSGWTIGEAALVLLVLASFDGDEARFAERLEGLFAKADIEEQIALYRGLPLYPAQERLVARASEGARSAVRPVFEAVAHGNPFPCEYFVEPMWNELVMTALRIGSRLAFIEGLDERRNPDLARLLIDYAHREWAAGRPVSPEVWRCVGPFASDVHFFELIELLENGTEMEQKAAALALSECPTPAALTALENVPGLWAAIIGGRLGWEQIA